MHRFFLSATKHVRLVILQACLAAALLLFSAPLSAQEMAYPPPPDAWNADSLGNHRAVITVSGREAVIKAVLPWRRRDAHTAQKDLILVDAATGQRLTKLYAPVLNREAAEIYFEPVAGHRTYYLYTMPYRLKGSPNYPTAVYLSANPAAGAAWWTGVKNPKMAIPAQAVRLEAVSPFNSFDPMERIATAAEIRRLLQQHRDNDFLVFSEDRLHPIKMRNDLPYRWIQGGLKTSVKGTARRGENYAFQLGVYAVKKDLQQVQVSFSALTGKNGQQIPASQLSCVNTGGVSYTGEPLPLLVTVPQQTVQPLWCSVQVPESLPAGLYAGTVTVTAAGAAPLRLPVQLTVAATAVSDHGVNEPWKQTRLPWLNSTLAQENTVISPYTPLQVDSQQISLLGRRLVLAPSGLPAKIQSFFPVEMTRITDQPTDLFIEPLHFHLRDKANHDIALTPGGVTFTQKTPGTVAWQASNRSAAVQMDVKGQIEFDGFVAYEVKLTALKEMDLSNVEFHLPFRPAVAKYFMGLGYKGGLRPDSIAWNWDVAHKNQDGGWIGDVNAGLQFSLRDQHYSRPLNTNFYTLKPLVLPQSWGNDAKGGIQVGLKGSSVLVNAYSGPRHLQRGDTLFFNFQLLITPFHPLNTNWQWSHRFYHAYVPVQKAKAYGANVLNVHHATYVNPYINYPYIAWRQMKAYVDSAHRQGMQVKIYNTIRELSNHAYELYPLRSLGHEVFSPGKGGGYAWLQEHLDSDYIAAWFVPELKDAAIINSGANRWHNYYVEGLSWLVKNTGIDGLYLDDVAYDRTTMKRVKRVLQQGGHPGIIDLHSANQYNERDGYNNSANLYMEHFPYLNKLWFGEYFDYEKATPDFFLTEVSGIPFGLMGEMLQDGGNPWRGMLYGMTSRAPWTGGNPRPVWKVWDEFGITGSQMMGYWVPDNPVQTNNPAVLATVYKKEGKALIALASWAAADTTVRLRINWQALGIDPAKATLTAPAAEGFQPAATFDKDAAIPVAKNKGWLLVLQ